MSLNNESFECPCHSKKCNELLYYKKDIRKAVKELKDKLEKKQNGWGNIAFRDIESKIKEIFGEELT